MMKGKYGWLILILILIGGVWLLWPKEKINKETIIGIKPTPSVLENKIKIAVMADVHNDGEELEKMLNIAKKDGADLVVVAGDLTNSGKLTELTNIKKVLEGSDVKYAVVPGNHEVSADNFKAIFDKNYQSIRIDDFKFILIDNSYWLGLGNEQKVWLQNEVLECKILVCLAIMHKPLNNTFSTHVMGENNSKVATQANWLRELLIDSGVKQIEAGHLHYASSYELEGIRTDIVGAISRERNTQSPRYTELVISKNLIERRVVEEEINDFGN